MAATVSNGDVDTLAAAVDAPWGPFTRVTDMTTLPVPNSNQRIELTTALGDTVYMTYEKLIYEAAAIVAAKAAAPGFTASVQNWKGLIAAEKTALDGLTAPHTYPEYLARYRAKRSAFPEARMTD